jgi:hypothetical protein
MTELGRARRRTATTTQSLFQFDQRMSQAGPEPTEPILEAQGLSIIGGPSPLFSAYFVDRVQLVIASCAMPAAPTVLQDQNAEIFSSRHTSNRPFTVTVQLKLVHQAINDMEQQVDGRPVAIIGFSLNRNASNDLGWQPPGNREFQATVGVDLANHSERCLPSERGVSPKLGGEKNFQDPPF